MRRIFTAIILSLACLAPQGSQAAVSKDAFQTSLLIRSEDPIVVAPGAVFDYKLGFKNTGSVTWKESDKNYLTIYTYEPKYRSSIFKHSSWTEGSRVTSYHGTDVKPGAVGFLTMKMKAPTKTGKYYEGFNLAANDLTWIPGGKFGINIVVGNSSDTSTTVSESVSVANPTSVGSVSSSDLKASVLIRSAQQIQARGGEIVSYTVGIKNAGNASWSGYDLKSASLIQIASVSLADARTSQWPSADLAVSTVGKIVNPGALAMIPFTFRAPPYKGQYTMAFRLQVAGVPVEGGEVEIPVTVTDDSGAPTPNLSPIPTDTTGSEPALRVGLFKTTNGETVTANAAYEIQDANGAVQLRQAPGSSVSLTYESGRYKAFSDQALTVISELPLRAVSSDPKAIFTISSFENRPSWNTSYNDNQFRGIIEINYSVANNTVWMINEIPIDQYLKGLVEASDKGPAEYLKALHTAARTYAYFHYLDGKKHADRNFHVDARYDQVYRGYGAEKRQPGISAAVEATRGVVVQYQGNPALTPYGARTDGRSRSYQEVWGKVIPYLISVTTQYDVGKVLWGHGVGISAEDAAARAKNDGWNYQQLLKYYYTGVDLVKKW